MNADSGGDPAWQSVPTPVVGLGLGALSCSSSWGAPRPSVVACVELCALDVFRTEEGGLWHAEMVVRYTGHRKPSVRFRPARPAGPTRNGFFTLQ